jgi:hypothetical protein
MVRARDAHLAIEMSVAAWMHNLSDQLGKNLLRDALSRATSAETEVEVLAAAQKIDVYCVPDPAREAERAEMGWLGELCATPTIFEPYRNTPNLRLGRHCLRKQLTWHHELERRANAQARAQTAAAAPPQEDTDAQPAVPFPELVIVSPGRPDTLLEAYGFQQARPGLYRAVPGSPCGSWSWPRCLAPARRCSCGCSARAGSCAKRSPTSPACPRTRGRRALRLQFCYTSASESIKHRRRARRMT